MYDSSLYSRYSTSQHLVTRHGLSQNRSRFAKQNFFSMSYLLLHSLCIAGCCRMLQGIAVLQGIAGYCKVLQCVAVCCNMSASSLHSLHFMCDRIRRPLRPHVWWDMTCSCHLDVPWRLHVKCRALVYYDYNVESPNVDKTSHVTCLVPEWRDVFMSYIEC